MSAKIELEKLHENLIAVITSARVVHRDMVVEGNVRQGIVEAMIEPVGHMAVVVGKILGEMG